MPKIYAFHEKDAERIKATVLRKEQYYANRAPARGRYPVGAGGGSSLIDLQAGAGGISSGTFASPSNATVTLLVPGTGAGMTATGGTSETAYNPWGTAVGASKFGKGEYRNGYFYVIVWDC